MRFKLVLKTSENQVFPFNYQYELSAGLYKIFMNLKSFLPRYVGMDSRDFLNQFTFSRIEIPRRILVPEGIRCLGDKVFLKISMGFPDISSELISKAFSLNKNQIQIVKKNQAGEFLKVRLILESVEFLPCPEITSPMRFKMLSPLVLSGGEKEKRFLSVQELDAISQRLQETLEEKFQRLYSQPSSKTSLSIRFDPGYCASRSEKDLYSLIRMKEGEKGAFSVMGILAPFEIEASPELIQVGYFSGFGEKTSMGFGMAEAIGERKAASQPLTQSESLSPR